MFDQTQQAPFMGAQYPQFGGFYGQQPTAMPKQYNILSKDEIDLIMKKGAQFSLSMTKEDQLKAICNHRKADGTGDALTFDRETGIAKCAICGAEFVITDKCSIDDVQDAVDKMLDYFQTAKYMFYDIPRETAIEFYQIIGLIKKVPKFFEYAMKNFNQHEVNIGSNNPYNQSIMQRYNNIGGFGFAPMYQQQPMGYGFGQPQQPQYNPAMAAGYPQAAYGQPQPNPFGYAGAGQPFGYQPQTQGFAYDPSQTQAQQVAPTIQATPGVNPAAQAAPTAPAAGDANVTNAISL